MVIFDVAGVLAHSILGPSLRALAEERYPEAQREKIIHSADEAWSNIEVSPEFTEDEFWAEVKDAGELEETVRELRELVRCKMQIYPEVRRTAARLKEAGYGTAILSNHAAEWFQEIMERFDMYEAFEKSLAIGSYAVRAKKPDREAFARAFKRIKSAIPDIRPEECLFIDDKSANVKAASEFGMKAIRFDAEEQETEDLLAGLREHGIRFE